MQQRPLNEEIRPAGWIRFLMVFSCMVWIRFSVGEESISFYWFVLLYFPILLWMTYWLMGLIRIALNRWFGEERFAIQSQRRIYTWYLNVPGALGLSELVYQGYLHFQSLE